MLAVAALLAGVLAAVAGTYSWATLPIVGAALLLFLAAGARIGGRQGGLDIAVIVVLAIPALQLIPLPSAVLTALSPSAAAVQDAISLQPIVGARGISIHPAATRESLLLAIAAALLFWACRAMLARGGLRLLCGAIGVTGFGVAIVSVAQRVTAPTTIFWAWRAFDPNAQPFGPFVNRNHFGTWLVLAISLTAGFTAARLQAHLRGTRRHGLRAIAAALLGGDFIGSVTALLAMLAAIAATLSRSAAVGLVAAAAIGPMLGRRRGRTRGAVAGAAGAALLIAVVAMGLNAPGLADRIETTLDSAGQISRLTIWRESIGVAQRFAIAGSGAGTFADVMVQYQRAAPFVLFNQAHNDYLQLLVETGVVGVAAFAILAALFGRRAVASISVDRSPMQLVRIGAAAGLVGVAVQSIWETGVRTPANLLLAAVAAAIVVHSAEPEPDPPQ